MQSVAICHFYNEEFLLPFWLKHHSEIFDHGVMINYGSTDNSVNIIKELCPDWTLIDSENEYFDAILCDFEVMKCEQYFKNFIKVALNVTEFVCGRFDALKAVMQEPENQGSGFWVPAKVVLPEAEGEEVDYNLPLIEQFSKAAFWEDLSEEVRSALLITHDRKRMIHNAEIGAYLPGRHVSNLPRQLSVGREVNITWFGCAPFTEETLQRRLQIKNKIPLSDKLAQRGFQHQIDRSQLEEMLRFAASIKL